MGKTVVPAKVHLHQCTVRAASRRSWKPLFSRKVLKLSPSQKHGGITLIMGVLQWLDISSLEEIRQSRRDGWIALYDRECFECVDDEDDKVECLWVRIKGKVSRADVMVGAR